MLFQDMPIAEYERKVKDLMKKRNGEPLYNGTLEHAVVIIHCMLKQADKSVDILTGKLNRNAYGHYQIVEAANNFLNHDAYERKIRVLFEDENLRSTEELSKHPLLGSLASGQVECRMVPKPRQGAYGFHFIVMDDDSYRFEPDKERFGSVAAFGDNENAQHLKGLFEKLWHESQGNAVELRSATC